MIILVINSGSSSLKFKIFNSKGWNCLYKGIVDGIGLKLCHFEGKNYVNGAKTSKQSSIKNHQEALKYSLGKIIESAVITDLKDIKSVGHRVVHGGEKYYKPTKITATVIKTLEKLSELAPLHNPANIQGIKACQKLLPKASNIAIFDTAFHHTMPKEAYLYALPYKFYKNYDIRRYGFHGTSHKYVSQVARKLLKNNNRIITCHIGNGSSIAAIKNGKSIDTSMGFTPLEGIPMGTRCGDIDPAIVFYLMEKKHYTTDQIDDILNKKSGLKGFSGISQDMRLIWEKVKKQDEHAILTLNLLSYRIAKYISAYASTLNGIDSIVFTAGIGENAWYLRENIINRLKYLHISLNKSVNKEAIYPKSPIEISDKKSKVKIYVIPTNEELEIAKQTFSQINRK